MGSCDGERARVMMGSWREDSVVEIGERVESEEGERGVLVVILVCCPRSRFMLDGQSKWEGCSSLGCLRMELS